MANIGICELQSKNKDEAVAVVNVEGAWGSEVEERVLLVPSATVTFNFVFYENNTPSTFTLGCEKNDYRGNKTPSLRDQSTSQNPS